MEYKFGFKVNNTEKEKRRKNFPFFIILGVIITYIIVILCLPLQAISATTNQITPPSAYTAQISWFGGKQSAVGAMGYGVLATKGDQISAPIASIAKTILALAVLKEKPLAVGQQGPEITITASDVELYKNHLAQNGSVLPVKLNDKLTQYQMLQGLMIPSGNNIADTLASWAFGSVSNYLNYANQMVKDWGLEQTNISDASGYLPQTVSSAQDLVVIGEKAINDPVLKEIVAQGEVTLPTAGKVKNYNTLLGQDNIIGIKTGNSDEAGGCFLLAAKETMNGKEIIIISAILGDTSRNTALQNSKTFLQANVRNFQLTTVVKAGENVGYYDVPWGKKVNVTAKSDLSVLAINGEKIVVEINLDKVSGKKNSGDEIGSITAISGREKVTVPAVLSDKISKPTFIWRLFHP